MNKAILCLIFITSLTLEGQELLKNFNFVNYKQSQINIDQLNDTWLKSIDINDDDIQALVGRANEKIKYGYLKEALKDLDKAVLADSNIAYVYDLRGVCLLNLNEKNKAEESFHIAYNLDSTDALSRYYLSGFFIERENYDSAEIMLKEFDETYPDNYLINYGLANIYLSKLKPEKAIRFYKRAAELNPEFPEAWYSIGLVNMMTNDIFNAGRFFEKTIKYNPEFAPAWFMRGILLLYQGKLDATMDYWNKAIGYDSINQYYKVSRSLLKIYLKDYTGGFAEINILLKDSTNKDIFKTYDKNNYDNSLFEFKEQLFLYNQFLDSLTIDLQHDLQQYLCYFLVSEYNSAEKILKKISMSYNKNSLIDFYHAINNEHLFKWTESEELYRKSLTKTPFINANNLHLGILLQKQKKYSESISYLSSYHKTDSSSSIIFRYRGLAYMNSGEYEAALSDFNNYLSVDSFDLDLTFNKGQCYKALEQYSNAKAQFDLIIFNDSTDNEAIFYKAECQLYLLEIDSCMNTLKKVEPYYYTFNPRVFLIRGRANLIKKNYADALFDLNSFLKAEPSDIDCLYYVSRIYQATKDYENLINTYNKILSFNAELPEIYYLRGMAYYMLKNLDATCKDMTIAKEKGYVQADFALEAYCK